MPIHVRFKLIVILGASVLLLGLMTSASLWLGAFFFISGLLYTEMIYPKWNFFGKAIQRVPSHQVALTFDDGPSLWTEKILDILKKENVKASFFLLGKNILRHPEICRRLKEEGHLVGIHGFSHTKLHFQNLGFIQKELDESLEAFQKVGVKPDPYFRFPHGFKNAWAVNEIKRRGWTLCAWGRGVWDSKCPGVETIVRRSLQLKGGEILLLHDGDGVHENPQREQTAEALVRIIKGLKEKGYEFTTLADGLVGSVRG